jgi:hypothetical protein
MGGGSEMQEESEAAGMTARLWEPVTVVSIVMGMRVSVKNRTGTHGYPTSFLPLPLHRHPVQG